MDTLLAKKLLQSQVFLENGTRIPVTHLQVAGNSIMGIKTKEKDGYSAIQLGIKNRKKMFVREAKFDPKAGSGSSVPLTVGQILNPKEVLKPGDIVNAIGISKGKGFAGGVKRYHFKGGPKTHGQGNRHRAPGSIGATTTPGRVYKGKRMAGRMGRDKVTVKNLQVVFVTESEIFVKGLVPGHINSFIILKKVGEDKKFVPIYVDKPLDEVKPEIKTEKKEVEVKENAKS